MTKYNVDFKLKIVQEMEESGQGPKSIGKKYGIEDSQILRWFKRYKQEGIEGLVKKSGQYSGEFKETVLEYIKQNHLSLNEAAIYFKIRNVSTIAKWRNLVEQEGSSRLYEDKRGSHFKMVPKKKKDKPLEPNSIEALREENEQLRMENAYLKKLRALVQQRLDQEAGKKSKS